MKPNNPLRSVLVALTIGVLALLVHPAIALAAPFVFGMAAETTTTTLIDEAMKVIFGKTLHNDIVADQELMSLFKAEMNIKQEETTGGRYIEQGHFWTLPAGAGWRLDDEYIPEAVSASFKNSRIYLKKFLVTLQMSGDTMDRVRGDEGAFLNYIEEARRAVIEGRAMNELDLGYLGFGSGIKARVDGAPVDNADGTMTITLKDHSGVAGWTDPWLAFLEDETVVFSSTAGATALRNAGTGQAAKVTDISEDTPSITVSAAAGLIAVVADGDYIFGGDAAGHSGQSSGTDRAMSGLMAAIDDGNILQTYNNIDRLAAGNRLWRSVVVDASVNFSGTLSEDCLNYAVRIAGQRGGAKITHFVTSLSAQDSYWKSVKGDRFFIDPGGNYKAGKGRLEIVLGDRTYPIRVARKLPPEVAFGIQADRFARLTLGQLTWRETTGSIWREVTDATGRKDSYYAVAKMYENLYCPAPRKQVRIENITPVF
jgi:hypothetical protein